MGIIQRQGINNAIISYLGIGIGFLNILILQPIMLTPEEIGLTRILFSTATLIATIFPLGFNGVVIKFLPKYRNKENYHNGFLGFVIFSSMFIFLLTILIFKFLEPWIISKYSNSKLFLDFKNYILPFSFFIGISGILNVYLFASFKSTFPTFINDFFLRIYMTLLVSVYFIKLINLEVFIQLFVGGYLIQLCVLLVYIFKHEKIKVLKIRKEVFKKAELKLMLSFAASMSLITICNMALKSIDIIMLGSYVSLSQVAVYSIGFLVAGFIELPASAIGKIADSKISDSFQKGDLLNINKIYTDSTKILLTLGCLLFILININSKDLISFLPLKYSAATDVIFLISISSLSNMATGINSSILFYTNQTKWGTILLVLLLILMILLNLYLIPKYGINGAGASVAISFILFNFFKFILIKNLFKFNPYTTYSLHVVAFSILLYLASYPISFANALVTIVIKSALVVLAYLFFLYKSKQFQEQFDSIAKWFSSIVKK